MVTTNAGNSNSNENRPRNNRSVEGEKRAEILSNQKEFDDIDTVYSSNYVRAMQTAKYFVEKNTPPPKRKIGE